MPSTINGIGTHYYGKANVRRHAGVCEKCGKAGELVSYDTRLWVVVVFVPIIPLGRKRILDYCGACTAHRAVPLHEWEALRRETLEGERQKAQARPGDAEAQMGLHRALIAFGEWEQADALQVEMERRFASDGRVMAHLAGAQAYRGSPDAARLYQKAHTLSPDLPEARDGAIRGALQEGRLDEARRLLDPERDDPGTLFLTAEAFQKAGRHREAIELFRALLRRFPPLGEDATFRKRVMASEKALGGRVSILPEWTAGRRRRRLAVAAAAAVLLGVWIASALVARNRPLHVVNGFDKPIDVEIEGCSRISLGGLGHGTLRVPEGRRRALIRGAVETEQAFDIESGLLGRFFDDRVFVLNPAGRAALVRETTVYCERPSGEGGGYSLHFGEPFTVFTGIDYAFAPFPAKIKVSSHASRETKTRIDLLRDPPTSIFTTLVYESRKSEALAFAEWALDRPAPDPELMSGYAAVATAAGRGPRVLELLRKGLARRPVDIAWHRLYQSVVRHEGAPALITDEYDALLKQDPGSSALLYLRGRLCPSIRQALDFHERAVRSDPKNAYAWNAIGYLRTSAGDWAGAREPIESALRADPDSKHFHRLLDETRIALGEHDAVLRDARQRLQKDPLDLALNQLLVLALAASGQAEEAVAHGTRTQDQFLKQLNREHSGVARSLRADALYATGRFAELEAMTRQEPEAPRRARWSMIVCLETGRPAEAEPHLPVLDGEDQDPWSLLSLAVAWRLAGDDAKAAAWRGRAADRFARGDADAAAAAAILKAGAGAKPEDVADLPLDPREKAVLWVAFAHARPDAAAEALRRAAALNRVPQFPYHLVRRAAGDR